MEYNIKDIPITPKSAIRFDIDRAITCLQALPDDIRNQVLEILSKLSKCYYEYQKQMEYLNNYCDYLVNNSPYFYDEKKDKKQ